MLKIYTRHNQYELCGGTRSIELSSLNKLCIMEESEAVDKTTEYDAYTMDAVRAYDLNATLKQKAKGTKALYWTYEGIVYAKQWKVPDAKLIVHSTYEESWCSLKRLMDLPASDVIAYLKQEGISLSMNP